MNLYCHMFDLRDTTTRDVQKRLRERGPLPDLDSVKIRQCLTSSAKLSTLLPSHGTD